MFSGVKASVFSGAIVSGAIVSGTVVVVGTVSTALCSPGPDEFKQSARRQAAGHLTAAEHPVAGRFVYPNAMCSRSSLR